MGETALRMLRIYLWIICVFHVAVGVGVNVSQGFMEAMANLYGAQVTFTPQLLGILHPLGAYMFVLGVLAGTAAHNPVRCRAIGYAFAALFIIRSLQRVVFMQQIVEAFNIDTTRNWLTMALFAAMGILLIVLQVSAEKQPASGT